MQIQSAEITYPKFDLSKLGVAPTVKDVATFFNRDEVTIYRHLYRGDFDVIQGFGVTRISIASIEKFLSRTGPYKPRKRARKIKEAAAAV
jgi:hypothetical protein